ncbi:hypothetical protein [Granulicella paludicola]|uniref:hypothetical protein n=1 Tax=Granulicella paludicola TaxID=474951 RepID=UPI0021E0853E|nr:hypothetical protein [Granulicella paludicola]
MLIRRAYYHPMDARLIITPRPSNFYHAMVLIIEPAQGWSVLYNSREECVTELSLLGLLTITEADEVRASNFDQRDRMLVFWLTEVEPEELLAAGFHQVAKDKVN